VELLKRELQKYRSQKLLNCHRRHPLAIVHPVAGIQDNFLALLQDREHLCPLLN
jgi:hypothetical protein